MVTKEEILKVAKEKGVVTREEFYSFSQYGNPISKGQYGFARIKKQKSKELRHLNKLLHELVLAGLLHSPHTKEGVVASSERRMWRIRTQ